MTVILQMNSSGLYELFKVFDPTYDEMCAKGVEIKIIDNCFGRV